MTATCARLAASATSVKSFRKGSVDGAWLCGGAAGAGATALAGDWCCIDELAVVAVDEDELALEFMDEAMGTFIMSGPMKGIGDGLWVEWCREGVGEDKKKEDKKRITRGQLRRPETFKSSTEVVRGCRAGRGADGFMMACGRNVTTPTYSVVVRDVRY